MRLVFFGSSPFGLPTLERLVRAHEVVAIVTQPDRPAGRGKGMTPTPVGVWAHEHAPGVPVIKPESVNEPGVVADLRGLAADAWVVIAFGQKLSRALLDGRFAINLHASRLPRWRGAAPINAAMLAGDPVTGNSVITLADRMDAGAVLAMSEMPIPPTATAGEMHDALAGDGPALIERVLRGHAQGTVEFREQDESRVTIAPKLSRSDTWIDFSRDADSCRARINALSPRPGVAVKIGGVSVKLLRAGPVPESPAGEGVNGALVDPEQGTVRCGTGLVQILEVQPAGKRAMAWRDFARGFRPEPGTELVPEVLPGHDP